MLIDNILLGENVMLYDYIRDNFTVERATMLMYSIDLIHKFNIESIESELEDIAFHIDDLDTAGRIGNINGLILKNLTDILSMHGILVLDLTDDLILIYNLTDTIKKVSEEYDANYILDRVDLEITEANEPIDIYVALTSLVTDSRSDDLYDNIFSVDEDLIANITKLLDGKKDVETQLDDTSEFIDRYKAYLNGRRYGLIYELIQGNVKVGEYDFNSLFLLVEDGIDQLTREDQLFELISLMLISNTPTEELSELLVKISNLMGDTVASQVMYLSDLKRNYLKATGESL